MLEWRRAEEGARWRPSGRWLRTAADEVAGLRIAVEATRRDSEAALAAADEARLAAETEVERLRES